MLPRIVERDLSQRLERDMAALGAPRPGPPVTADALAALPATVQRYLRFAGAVNQPPVASFRAHLRAS